MQGNSVSTLSPADPTSLPQNPAIIGSTISDADECFPTGCDNPQRGREYRQQYCRNHPGGLEGNP
jgi:hypothetical protein